MIKMANVDRVLAQAAKEQAKLEESLAEKLMKEKVLDLERVTLECGIAKQKAIGCGGYIGIKIH